MHTPGGFEKAKEFLEQAEVLPIDDELAELTIALKRNNNIKLADALIAATLSQITWSWSQEIIATSQLWPN